MLFQKKKAKLLAKRAEELEAQAMAKPYGAVEADFELAAHMGAFVEDAVGLDDFYELEDGAFGDLAPSADPAGAEGR
jgi:hypothetical protein